MYKQIKKIISTKSKTAPTKSEKKISKKDEKNIRLLKNSDYFDEDYYLTENPDINEDPYEHYYFKGFKESRSPSFNFSNDFYLNTHKDVAKSGMNPLIHYLKYGKATNRLISKDFGLSLKKIYETKYDYNYFYKIYLKDNNLKRVNLFFDKIDETIYKFNNLFEFIINYCNKYNYKLRIIYHKADFGLLKSFLEKNKIELPSDITYLNLKEDNYLEVNFNDKYICTSWKNARSLLNTSNINTIIYFYLKELDKNNKEDYFQTANVCYNKNVVILNDNSQNLQKLKKFNYKYEYDIKETNNKRSLCCDFKNMFIEGITVLNYLSNNNMINDNWNIFIIHEKRLKFHLDNGIIINTIPEKRKDIDLFLKIDYDKPKNLGQNHINIYLEEITDDTYNILNINDTESINAFNKKSPFVQTKIKANDQIETILEIFNKINYGN